MTLQRPRRTRVARILLAVLTLTAAATAAAHPPRHEYAPDPVPHPARTHWVVDITARGSQLVPTRALPHLLPQAVPTPRVLGRFALELYIGTELLDRARFNVPLTGDGASHTGKNGQPRPHFDDNIFTVVHIPLADNPRAAYLLLVDRDTETALRYAWPPEPTGDLVPWRSSTVRGGPGAPSDGGLTTAPGPTPDASSP